MSNSKSFFSEKKNWSKYKDKLLGSYLPAYFQKILCTNVDTLYIDGFAGKGKFDDGQNGSPIIVRDILAKTINQTSSKSSIYTFFIDFNHANELKNNLNDNRCHTISGDYKTEVPKLLNSNVGKNVFLYVDPYGIKHLHFSIFQLLISNKYYSKELLLNLNSSGFLREGIRLLKATESMECAEEVAYTEEGDSVNSISNMNEVAGGEYWQQIANDKILNKISLKDAEELFVKKYMEQLNGIFNYAINIPIRTGDALLPKYQMIYCTDNIDGILLMADIIIKCDKEMTNDYRNGQTSIFDYEFDMRDIEKDILNALSSSFVPIKEFCLNLYSTAGVKYIHKDINNSLKKLEAEGRICVSRNPTMTPGGKVAKALSIMDKNYHIRVKRNEV